MCAKNSEKAVLHDKLAFLTRDYMPDACWTVEGAFRFDRSLYHAAKTLATNIDVRRISRVAGAPSCLWSLDWFTQSRPMEPALYVQLLDAYTRHDIAVTLVFDNPFIREEDLNDPYPLHLIAELMRRSTPKVRHAVCVASDRLAEHLRKQAPGIPLYCHVNRLLAMSADVTRSAGWYQQLFGLYQRVCLHPADAVNPAIYSRITEPERMDVIMNDPCLRACPARREHLQILDECRRQPYSIAPMQGRIALMQRIGCHVVDKSALCQKRTATLTKSECQALYDAGYRSFTIQAKQFRNEMTLIWDLCQCMFNLPPEMSHKQATINTNLMLQLLPEMPSLASGLAGFSSSPLS